MIGLGQHRSFLKYFLIFCLFFQYLLHLFINVFDIDISFKKHLQFFSPYLLFFLIFLCYVLKKLFGNKKIKISNVDLVLLIILTIVFQIFRHYEDQATFENIIKSYQFFYGIQLVFIGTVCLLKLLKVNDFQYLYTKIVKFSLVTVSIITAIELIATNFVIKANDYFLYKNIYVPFDDAVAIATKPIGVALYAQPNAVYISYLLILSLLLDKRLTLVLGIGVMGLLASMGGTGIMVFFLCLVILGNAKKFIAVLFILFFLYCAAQYSEMLSAKINIDYWIYLFDNFLNYWIIIFSNFTLSEYLFGISQFGINYYPGFTHDWAYLDILYEGGIIGLVLYLLSYGFVIKNALLFSGIKCQLWILTIYLIIFSNFHYASLNFYFGQMLFGILGAINYCRYKITDSNLNQWSMENSSCIKKY